MAFALAIVCLALSLGIMGPAAVCAESEVPPYYGGVSLEPVEPSRLVELVFQTVDAAIVEEEGETLLEVSCTFGLHNTSKTQASTLTLGFPGRAGGQVHFDPGQFLSFSLSTDGRRVAWQQTVVSTKVGQQVQPVEWYVWRMAFDRDQQRSVALKYRASLGEGALPRFSFALGGSGWRGEVGSARVSLHFPSPISYSQLADVEGEGAHFDGKSLTWSRVDFEPQEELSATFIKLSLWEEMERAREEVRKGVEIAQAHYRLGRAYLALAEVQPTFLSQAVAELEKAKELSPLSVETRQVLFQIYSTQGGAYLVPAIEEAEALLEMNAGQGKALEDWLVGAYLQLASEYEAQELYAQATDYLEKALALAGKAGEAEALNMARRREELYLGWVLKLLQEGKPQEAFGLAEEHLPQGSWAQDYDLRPRLGPFQAEIEVSHLYRAFHLEILPSRWTADWGVLQQELLKVTEAAARLPGVEAEVRVDEQRVSLDLKISALSAGELQKRRDDIVQLFQARQGLAELAGLFSADDLERTEAINAFQEVSRLEGTVDLAPLAQVLGGKVEEIEARLRSLEGQPSNGGERRLRLALLKQYRQGWLRTISASRVRYRLEASTPSGALATKIWALSWGEKRTLNLEARRLKPLTYGVAGGAMLVLAMIALLLARRPSADPGQR